MRLQVFAIVGAVALAASALPSFAAPSVFKYERTASIADETTSTKSSTDAGDRIVCKAAGTTGTRLPAQRVCRTQHEWDIQREQDRRNLEKSQTVGTNPQG